MDDVQDFIVRREEPQRSILRYFQSLLMSYPGVTSKISYGIPFYYRKSWICYLNPLKNGGMELGFTRGNELSNGQGLLEAKNRKQIRGISFLSIDDIPEVAVHEIINEALLLDEKKPYPVRKKKS